MAETKKIIRQSLADLVSLANQQIGVLSGADADLGYKMWGGKDDSGNVVYFLAKDKPGQLTTLKLTDPSVATGTSGIVSHSAAGLLAGDAGIDLLADVVISSVTNGEVLTYDSGTSKWINAASSVGLNYKGTWNADTNTPALASGGIGGSQGDYYIVSVASTGGTSIDGESDWQVKDWITNSGSTWDKIDNTDAEFIFDDIYGHESGDHQITVDDGDMSWLIDGAYSFNIDLTNVDGTADGFQILNGTDFVKILRTAADTITIDAVCDTFSVSTATDSDITLTPSGDGQVLFDDSCAFSIADAYSGTGTATTGAPRIFFGTNTPSGDDSCILIGRDVDGTNLFSHGIRDESTFISATDGAYSSFDSQYQVNGSIHYNHMNQYQARAIFNGTDQVDAVYGMTFACVNANSGTINHAYGLHVLNPTNSGGGTIADWRAIYIPAITTEMTAKYALYSVSTDLPSYHGGLWQTGDDIQAAGVFKGQNLSAYEAGESTYVGDGITSAQQSLFYTTTIGAKAGTALTAGANYNTLIGARAGYDNTSLTYQTSIGAFAGHEATTNGFGVNIGFEAGYYETAGNKLFIDNDKRTNEADARVKALIYGTFDAATANQQVTINGDLNVGETFKLFNYGAALEYLTLEHNSTDLEEIIGTGSKFTKHITPVELADDAEFGLPDATAGYGIFLAGDGDEFALVSWDSAGVPVIILHSLNTADSDSDGNFCFYQSGTQVKVKNRLGAAKKIIFHGDYWTP